MTDEQIIRNYHLASLSNWAMAKRRSGLERDSDEYRMISEEVIEHRDSVLKPAHAAYTEVMGVSKPIGLNVG